MVGAVVEATAGMEEDAHQVGVVEVVAMEVVEEAVAGEEAVAMEGVVVEEVVAGEVAVATEEVVMEEAEEDTVNGVKSNGIAILLLKIITNS